MKRIYMTGEGSLTKALVVMFALASTFTAGIHWAAAQGGAVIKAVAQEGQAVIPGSGSVIPIGIGLVLGGFLFGGMIMAGGCASGTLGRPWGRCDAGGYLPPFLGAELTGPVFEAANAKVAAGFLNDGMGVRDIGIILGAAVALLMAGRFAFNTSFRRIDALTYAVGGLLMGVGARIAGGCNIGALFSGIGNLSLSGWVFGVMLWAGAMASLKYFANKVNIIGPERHTVPKEKLSL